MERSEPYPLFLVVNRISQLNRTFIGEVEEKHLAIIVVIDNLDLTTSVQDARIRVFRSARPRGFFWGKEMKTDYAKLLWTSCHLRRLQLERCLFSPQLVHAACLAPVKGANSSNPLINLECLSFFDIIFDFTANGSRICIDRIGKLVKFRSRHLLLMQELEFKQCKNLTKEIVDGLRDVVYGRFGVEVRWDGVEEEKVWKVEEEVDDSFLYIS